MAGVGMTEKELEYWNEELQKCKDDPVYFYERYFRIKQKNGTIIKPRSLTVKESENLRAWCKKK